MSQAWYQVHSFNGDSSWFGGVRSTSVNMSRQIIACGSDDSTIKLLREEKLRQHEENLRRKQEIREEKQRRYKEKFREIKQSNQHQNNINFWNNTSNQKQTSNFWSSNSSTNSNNKIYVQGYRRKDGTYVEGYWREK